MKYLFVDSTELNKHLKMGSVCGSIAGIIISVIEAAIIITSNDWSGLRLGARVGLPDFSVLFYGIVLYGFIGLCTGFLLAVFVGKGYKTPKCSEQELVSLHFSSTLSILPAVFISYKVFKVVSSHISSYYFLMLFAVTAVLIVYLLTVILLNMIFRLDFINKILTVMAVKSINLKNAGIFFLVVVVISFIPSFLFSKKSHSSAGNQHSLVSESSIKNKKPNIVMILIDTLRADHLSGYGYMKNTSPNIDQVAEDGILYKNVVAQSSWTRPSVASIFTSLYPTSHGITQLDGDLSVNYILPEESFTLSENLQNNGYYTAGFITNPHITEGFGFKQGFNELNFMSPPGFYGLTIFKLLDKFFKVSPVKLFYHDAYEVNRRILPWLEKHENDQFYLYVHYIDPHMPYFRHSSFFGLDRSHFHGKWEKQTLIDLYDGEISYVDEQIGRLIAFLKMKKMYDDTMIIITSDHGEEFFDHQGWDHGITLYEEEIKVPLILKYPGDTGKGLVEDNIVLSLDIAPTILDSVGISVPEVMQGSVLQDENRPHEAGRYIFSEIGARDKGMRSMRVGKWKLIVTSNFPKDFWKRSYPEFQLFNILSDPEEKNNLADKEKIIVANLYKNMQEVINNLKSNSVVPQKAGLNQEIKERLKALGYIK